MSPDYLNEVIKGTSDKVFETNLIIIRSVAEKLFKQLKNYGEITIIPSTLKQFKALMNTGMVAEEIEKELSKAYPEIQKEVHRAFLESAAEMSDEQIEFAKNIIEVEGLDYNPKSLASQKLITDKASELNLAPSQIKMLEDSYKSTNKLLKNITNTSGICTEVNFSDLCDEAYMKIRHGGMSMNQAIVEIIDGLSKKGLVVQYAGRVDSIETALTRAVRTAINQANARIVLQGCAEMGVSFVKVSEHLGARVTGTGDYRDHSWWQGKVYSLDWSKGALAGYELSNKIPSKMKYISQIRDVTTQKKVNEYQDFIEACGYGEMLGICGINCRHTFHAWYPDINIDRGPQIDPEENAKRYELEQKAREMERSIRKDRRELNVKDIEINNLPEGIEKDQAQARFDELSYRVTEKTNTYNEFIRVNKLGNGTSRLKVAGYTGRREAEPKMVKPNEKMKKLPNFTPADNMQAAEMFAQLMVDNEQWAALGVRYKGIGVDVANEINETLADFMSLFRVEKFGGIYVPQMNTKLGLSIKNDKMAYNPARNSILINPTYLKNMKMANKYISDEAELVTEYLKNPLEYTIDDAYTKKILDNSANSGRATVPMNLKECLWHELGHSLENQLKNDNNFDIIKANKVLFDSKISGYATDSMSEYLAESFTSYMKGEKIIDPELIKAFDSLKR